MENKCLVKYLSPYRYQPMWITARFFAHNNNPVDFIPVIYDFSIKYTIKEGVLYLNIMLEN